MGGDDAPPRRPRPESHVLDVGCGIGRVAAALTGYLSPQANNRGFDVIKFAVEWCQREIGGQFPNFEFRHVDVFNESYNPTGAVTGAQFSFPYAAGQFDFALATSLYTHLLPDAAERYLAESARVLRPGGTLFSTWYLAGGGDAPAPIMARFPVDRGHYRLQSAEHPASAVSYAEPWVREVFERHQFAVERVVTGKWRGGDGRHNQDFIVARRR